jgi:hypothetical protein
VEAAGELQNCFLNTYLPGFWHVFMADLIAKNNGAGKPSVKPAKVNGETALNQENEQAPQGLDVLTDALRGHLEGEIVLDGERAGAGADGGGNRDTQDAAVEDPEEEPGEDAEALDGTEDRQEGDEDRGPRTEDREDGETELDAVDEELAALQEEAKDSGWPASAQKRLGKLLAQKKALKAQLDGAGELREERDRLAAEVAALKAGEGDDSRARQEPRPTMSSDENPLEPAELKELRKQEGSEKAAREFARQRLRLLQRDPDKLEQVLAELREFKAPVGDGSMEVVESFLDGVLERSSERLSSLTARREAVAVQFERQQAEQRVQYEAAARKVHPWLSTKSDPRVGQFNKVLSYCPQLKQVPGYEMLIADAIAYQGIRLKELKAKGAAPAATKTPLAPVKVPRGGSAPVRTRSASTAATSERFLKSGSKEDGVKLVESFIET